VWAVEIKLTSAPKLSRGFYLACEDLKPSRKIIIHGGDDRFTVGDGVEAIPLGMLGTLF
jgi:predicted AAA+ superfamily ATPase